MSFPSKEEIITAMQWARDNGYRIVTNTWGDIDERRDKCMCPLTAVHNYRNQDREVLLYEQNSTVATSLDCETVEVVEFTCGVDGEIAPDQYEVHLSASEMVEPSAALVLGWQIKNLLDKQNKGY